MGIFSPSSGVITTTVLISLLCFCFDVYGFKSCLKEERIALLQLSDSFTYLNGPALANYWVGDNCCDWIYITCDFTHSVISISLRAVQLEKWYPNASLFTHFKKLQSLDLAFNNLGGWIMPQALCELRNLKTLDLSGNNLDDEGLPSCLARGLASLKEINIGMNSQNLSSPLLSVLCGLRNLRKLDLSFNVLSNGSLPPCMLDTFPTLESLDLSNLNLEEWSDVLTALRGARNLRELSLGENKLNDEDLFPCLFYNNSLLKKLDLSSNHLRGSHGFSTGLCKLKKLQYLKLNGNSIQNIPWTCLSQLNSLKILDLSYNQIVGTMPPISNLTSLRWFDFSGNKLEGVAFFSMFANLSKLEVIGLSNNKDLEVETEFPTWVPSFQLIHLSLDNCKLKTIPRFLDTQYNLGTLSLSYNSLQGKIPSWLLYNATLYDLYSLSLSSNQLHGPFPLPFKNEISMLQYLDISDNSFQGILPRNMDLLFPNLLSLNMSINKFQGYIPPSFGNLIDLEILDLSNNYFVGEVPLGLTQNNTSLLHLVLSRNNLHAMPRVSNMTKLRTLSLDGNLFTRPFHFTPSSVPSLVLLDISGNYMLDNIQDWLLPTAFPNLISLVMRENHFVGCLPPSLCQMHKLRVLDVSHNNLSGTIPSCLNNITSWLKESDDLIFGLSMVGFDEIDMFYINFATKGNFYSYRGLPLYQITGIDLSLNQLSGNIPSQMGELRALRSLNLSHNSLMGNLPESFQELELMESLDLSYNKLVGTIPPQMIQLSFVSIFSVAFNRLSGKIPYEKNFATFKKESYIGNPGLCGPPLEINCSSPQPHHKEHEEGDDKKQSLLDNNLFYYSYVAICFLLGFWAVVAPLLLSRKWHQKYYKIVDRCIDWCNDRLFWCLYYIKNH